MKIRNKIVAMIAAAAGVTACFCSCDVIPAPDSADENEPPRLTTRVVGYLPDWSYEYYRENLDFEALTHINIAFCNPDKQGNLSCGIPDDEMTNLVEKAHCNNVKVIAALGGGGGCNGYLPLLDTPRGMADFNGKIMQFCEKYGLDGIDLDIELDSSHQIWNYYGEWVGSLRDLCDGRGYEMSTATAQWVAAKVSGETFADFDFVNIMAYDDDDKDEQSHSSYDRAVYWMDWFHTEKDIPEEKLVLGVPFYGRGYTATGALDWESYEPFSSLVQSDPSNYNGDAYNGVAYNGADMMRRKCALAKEYGGIMIWEVTLDADGEYSLLKVIKEEMLKER